MSTGNLLGSKTDSLAAICVPVVWKMWEPRLLTNLWASTTCYSDSFTFSYFYFKIGLL
jgi:hypothetical protein